jgi:hypothetical protein
MPREHHAAWHCNQKGPWKAHSKHSFQCHIGDPRTKVKAVYKMFLEWAGLEGSSAEFYSSTNACGLQSLHVEFLILIKYAHRQCLPSFQILENATLIAFNLAQVFGTEMELSERHVCWTELIITTLRGWEWIIRLTFQERKQAHDVIYISQGHIEN